ncbi:MAG: hypothetical protein R2856_26955 [Caldilineaceae bacterium]
MTEAGLARMFKHNDGAGDVGWLYPEDSVSQNHYWASLDWFNDYMVQDDFALGACLFQVGHGAGWDSFRHIGNDNNGQPIDILNRVKTLRDKVHQPVNAGEPTGPSVHHVEHRASSARRWRTAFAHRRAGDADTASLRHSEVVARRSASTSIAPSIQTTASWTRG